MSRLLLVAAALVLALPRPSVAEPLPTVRPNFDILIVAHRGFNERAPENSIPAIQEAIDYGAAYVELDIRFTKDGVPVLMHDATVNRTTLGTGKVADMTVEEFQQLELRSRWKKHRGIHPPTFEEALQVMQGKMCLYWDAKEVPNELAVSLLKKYGFGRDCVTITTRREVADGFLKHWDNPPLMPGVDSLEGLDRVMKEYPTLRAINTSGDTLPKEVVDTAHARGILVFTNALVMADRPGVYKRIIKTLGSDALQADHLDKLKSWIEKNREKAGK